MGNKKICTFVVLAVLLSALFAVSAYALPDNPPTCSLSSNTEDATTTAVLTSVSVDTLANAGISSIKIYEGGSRIYTKSCGYATTCVATKTVVHTTPGDHDYHAVCRDRAGQETRSGTVTVDFEGMNRPPVIDSFAPASPTTIDEDEILAISVSAHDPDGDSLSYEWRVDGVTQPGETSDSFDFERNVGGDSDSFVVAVYVRDGNGGVDVQTWTVIVNDLEPGVVLDGDDGLTECDTFAFDADIDSYDDIVMYSWDFGDGEVLNSADPADASVTHQFPEDGTYTVAVTVMDADGDTASDSMDVEVLDIAPVVDAGEDQEMVEGDTAFFHGEATMPCDADSIVSWDWDFGDGNSASGQDVDNTFTDDGTFTVILTVCDDDGSCTSDTLTVTVNDTEPAADFDYVPADPIEGDEVNFTDTSVSYDDIVSWEWDFDGDGVIDSADQDPSWTYDIEGDYTVCLTVTDEDGDADTHCETITVGNNAPEVDLVANVTAGDEPLSVHFDCIVTGGNAPFDFMIDFGDGSAPEPSGSAEHTYTDDGDYNATCTVMDADGDVDSDSGDVTVFNVVPVVDLMLNTTSGTEPLDVHADCIATDGNEPYNYSIDFGDGTVVDSDSADHTYVQDGTYEVICTVEDADGDTASDSELVDVFDTVPVIDFTWDPALPEEHDLVDFDSTIDVYDVPYDVEWDFDGDGAADDTVEDPSWTFASGGDYNVTLTVCDDDGSCTSVSHVVHVASNPPEAEIIVDPLSGTEPLDVDITCNGYDGDAPLSYEIDFGDGTAPSSASVTTHTFAQNGTYNITCTVTDIDGDMDVDWEVIDVFDTVPNVSFTYSPADPLEGETVDFDATIDVYDTPVDIVWDFGDGGSDTVEDPSHVFVDDGSYPVTMTVTDADGSVASFTEVVNVSVNAADVMLVANTTSGYEPLDVEFACAALDGNPPYTYEIDFGDGTAPASSSSASHTYVQNGTYTAVCTVTDDDGDVTNDTVVIDVLDTVPFVDFDYTPLSPVEGDDVDFDGTITAYDTPVTWEWDFDGDGVADSFDEDPTWNFALEGDYNVTLTATDDDGSVTVYWEVVSVGNNEPFVNLLADPLSGPENMNVTFNCTVTNGNDPLSFSMDYGDGSSGTDQDSVHQYTSPGSYVATCTVTDADGDVDSDFVIINVANNAPNVTMTADDTNPTEGQVVDFECGITGGDEPFSILVDFGDGTTTTDPSEDHAYALEGIYTASCTVTDDDGDIGFDDIEINVSNNAPVVNLDTNVTSGYEPLSVEYNCSVGGGNGPFSYLVDFGDGSTSTSATGTHDYPTPGVYPMTCTVTDTDGDVDDDTVGIHVLDNPPVVDLIVTPSTSGVEGDSFHFFCNVTGGNEPLGYVLDFGDGTSTTSDTADHTYGLEGSYNATCTVTDLDGDVGLDDEVIDIANNPPTVNLVANTTSGLEPLTVNFTCEVGGGNEPFSYVVDFGDGTPSVAADNAVHTYPTEGDFDATCTVTDVDGDVGSDIEHIEVINNPPVVDLVAVPMAGLEGVNVSFTCNVVGGNEPLAYVLDFGDGTSTTDSSAWHAYPLEGDYNASCQVIDDDGDIGEDWEWINVSNNPPVVNLVVNDTVGLEPLSVNYTCNVGGGNEPFSYVMDFGDGSPVSSSPEGTHDYPLPGIYDMECTVTDVDGDVDSDSVSIEVIDNPPVVDLVATPSVGPEGINVSFDCLVTGGNEPFSYVLDFGDGSASVSTDSASHVYPLEGLYDATCTVTDLDGDVGSDWEEINVTNNVPVVNLVTNVTDGTEPLDVFFNCTLVGGGNEPFSYAIDFGDGTPVVASQTASHTYPQNGTYDASCTITDSDGDVSVPDVESIDVYDSEPDTLFNFTPSSPIEGDMVSFTDLSTAYDGIVAWDWDLGDGNTSTLQNPSHVYDLEGNYFVTLCTTDGDGSSTCHSEWVDVGNNVPVVDVTVVPDSGTEPLAVAVTCTVTSGGNAPFTYNMMYGDGDSTSSASSMHGYDQDGSYPVTCQVTDVDGDVGTDVETVTVNDTEPVADFTWAPASPSAGDPVNFTDLSTAYDGIASWAWDFENDGVTDDTGQHPSHVFPGAGLYVVNLTVTDNDGSTDWTIRTVAVNISTPAPVIFSVNVEDITNVSANVTWATDQAADSDVEYGPTMMFGSSVSDPALVFSHEMELSGLTPNTTYYFLVTSCNTFGDCTTEGPFNFTTLPTGAIDVTAPVVSLMAPADGSTDVDGDVMIQYGVTDDMASTLSCDIYSNTSGAWAVDLAGQSTADGGTNTHSYVGLPDGSYMWNVGCSDGSNSAFAAADWTFDVNTSAPADVTPPIVTLMAPADGSSDADGDVVVQYNVTDDMAAIMACDIYSNTSGAWAVDLAGQLTADGASNMHTYLGLADGDYGWNVVCSDGTNSASAPANFTFDVDSSVADVTPPIVTLMAPADGSSDADGNVTVQYNVTDDLAATMSCDIYSNTSGAWAVDLAGQLTADGASGSFDYTGLADGSYRWNVGCSDGSNSAFAAADWTFDVNTSSPGGAPVVTASASPASGAVPLLVQFNASVVGGDAPLSFDWDFDGDGTVDSTAQDPMHVFNSDGVYTATVNVTDDDGEWDTDSVTVSVSSTVRDIAVNTITDSKVGTTAYLWDVIDVTSDVENQGGADETVTVELEVDGVVVDSTSVVVGAGATVPVTLSYNATAEGFNTVVMRAVPLAGEVDLADQTQSESLRVWSVDDIVSMSTREVFLSTNIVIAGGAFSVFLPVQNSYAIQGFDDLRTEVWSSDLGAFSAASPAPVQYVDLAGGAFELVQWDFNAVMPGTYVMSAELGNGEIDHTMITSKMITVV